MKLQKWALVAEISGAFAVVLSLVFVGYQLKQGNEETALNTQALELNAYQQLIERIADFNLSTIEYPELRAVRAKVEAGETLSQDEGDIFNAFLFLAYRNGDLAYMQFERGIIDEERLRSGMGLLVNYLEFPAVQAHWERAKSGFVPSYRAYIDSLIAELETGSGE